MSAYHHNTPSRDWKGCTECRLHLNRRSVVVRRSGLVHKKKITHHMIYPGPLQYPHILLIGEAPGQMEDLVGVPFWGEAGRILDIYLTTLLLPSFYFTITNTVCCRPTNINAMGDELDEDGESLPPDTPIKNRAPTEAEINQCLPHTKELLSGYKFSGIVALGEIPTKYLSKLPSLPSLSLTHPAAISRKDYKHLPILKEARKLQKWLSNLK